MSRRSQLIFGEHRIFAADENSSDGMLVLRWLLRLVGAFLIYMAYGHAFYNPHVYYGNVNDVVVCPQPFVIATHGSWGKLTNPSGIQIIEPAYNRAQAACTPYMTTNARFALILFVIGLACIGLSFLYRRSY
jgi:hypothetical protein